MAATSLFLLYITSLGHFSGRIVLCLLQGIINLDLTSESLREQIAHFRCYASELGDRSELHAGVRHWLNSWMQWISRVHGIQGHLGKWNLGIFWIGIKRSTRARRNIGPAFFGCNQFSIVLRGCPTYELLGSFSFLCTSWNCERPSPQPV